MEDFKLYDMDSSEFYELIDSTRVELKRIMMNIEKCQTNCIRLWINIQIYNYF